MKKSTIVIIVVVVILVAIIAGLVSNYNGVVSLSEEVDNKFATIDTMLQRRADLIPNLVNTVKGYTNQEQAVIDSVTDARAKLAGANSVGEKANADQELSTALSNLLVVVENYPDLKSHAEIADVMQQNSYLQKEITAARDQYNDTVNQWNHDIFMWPVKMIVAAKAGYTSRIPFTTSFDMKEKARGTFFDNK